MEEQPHRKKGNLTAAEAMLRAERRKHRNEVDQMNNKIVNLELQLRQLSTNFDKVNRKLAAMSSTSYVSDKIILETYEELCQAVRDWIDASCRRLDNVAQMIESDGWSATARLELDKLLDDGAAVELVRLHPRCGDFFLTKIVLRFLFEFVLRQARWIPGISADQEKILQFALDSFQTTFPDKGPESREAWRSDTYKSLSASPRLQGLKDVTLEDLTAKLLAIMTHFMDDKSGCDEAGLKAIIQAAAELADSIRRCPVQYSFIYGFVPQMTAECRSVNAHTLERNNLIDVETGVSIRSLADDRPTGEVLCTITPTLAKLAPDGTVVRLVNGTALMRMKTDDNPGSIDIREGITARQEDEKTTKEQANETAILSVGDLESCKSEKHTEQPKLLDTRGGNDKEPKEQAAKPAISTAQKCNRTWASVVKMSNPTNR